MLPLTYIYICIDCDPLFQMSIQLPTLRSLRSLLDKMKNLAPSLTICSASNGDLSFIVETDSAMVVSRYYNLMLEHTNGDASTTVKDGQLEEITCLVDSKQIAMCCASIQVTLERLGTTHQSLHRFFLSYFSSVTFEWWEICCRTTYSIFILQFAITSQCTVTLLLWMNESIQTPSVDEN